MTVAAIPIVHFDRPEKFLRRSGPVVLEEKISTPGRTAAGRLVITKIKDVLVIQPGMVARIVIKVTHIRAIGANGVGLVEFVDSDP